MKDLIFRLAILTLLFIILPYMSVYWFFPRETQLENSISVYDNETGKIQTINLEDYIIGVVSAEMPASFEIEALKAQSIAARTYAVKRKNDSFDEHKGADVCMDFSHCQAYYDKKQMKEVWNNNYKEYYQKIKNAVYSTEGMCLMYQNEYATTVFHSCSNGKTENASDVWGGDFPYLISVDSPGDSDYPQYISQQTFSKEEFINILKSNIEINDEFPPIGEIKYTIGNNVDYITFFDKIIKGTQVRELFSLKSTAFSVEDKDDKITFTVNGNGHGVGMSQYGANYMAKQGLIYTDILSSYYPGTYLDDMYKIK